jgi:hypothetical protein
MTNSTVPVKNYTETARAMRRAELTRISHAMFGGLVRAMSNSLRQQHEAWLRRAVGRARMRSVNGSPA